MPVSTADCERGFSKHNLINTRIRARLKTENVDTLMRMSIDPPDLSNKETFDFADHGHQAALLQIYIHLATKIDSQ